MGLPADRPAGSQWVLVVGCQWVRPANQRITGVGERYSSPLELGSHGGKAHLYCAVPHFGRRWPVCL